MRELESMGYGSAFAASVAAPRSNYVRLRVFQEEVIGGKNDIVA